jgi:ribosomal protein L19E
MKSYVIAILIAIFPVAGLAQRELNTILDSYLQVKDALVSSDQKKAADEAERLSKLIEQKSLSKDDGPMLATAKTIARSNSIEEQRKAFAELSVRLWKLVKNSKDIDRSVYYQYCSMKKSYWISDSPVIKNPYYGSSMLTCGNVSEKKIK